MLHYIRSRIWAHYRDAAIISVADMLTSLLAGFVIFGILGNLAHELDTTVDQVIKGGGTSLAFVSYPQALANFPGVPQVSDGMPQVR